MEKENNCSHRWSIDDKGLGICLRCGEGKQHATPTTIGDYISRKQVVKGIAEARHYTKLYNLSLI